MGTEVGSDVWKSVDPWWDGYVNTYSLAQVEGTATTLDRRWEEDVWGSLNSWWTTYSESRRDDVAELKTLLEDLNEAWEQSESRFDVDPMAVDWTRHRDTRGPLRPNQEENWSQWVAHLLRASSGEFLSELFGERFDEPPDAVRREVHLPDQNGPDRYADILVFYPGRGISIEVKKNDEHYSKTTHTTGLIERQFSQDWHHVILLPKYKESVLRQIFGDSFHARDGERPHLCSDLSDAISVVYWQDVSAAIRNVLQRDIGVDSHWEASAYLFCTLLEQKILGFNPYPMIEQIANSDNVIHASQSLSVATGDVVEQLSYLREREVNHHE